MRTTAACSTNGQPTQFLSMGMCAGALYEISNQDALCIVEQDILDQTYSMLRYT